MLSSGIFRGIRNAKEIRMKTILKTTAGLAMFLLAAHPMGFAQWVEAEVTSVNAANKTMEIRKVDDGGNSENLTVKVDANAQANLNSIKSGDRVKVDLNRSFFKGNTVKAITPSSPNASAAGKANAAGNAANSALNQTKANAESRGVAVPGAAGRANAQAQGGKAQGPGAAYVPGSTTGQQPRITGQASVGGIKANGTVNSTGGTVAANAATSGAGTAPTGIRTSADTAGAANTGLTGTAGATTGTQVKGSTGVQNDTTTKTGNSESLTGAGTNATSNS